MEDNVVNAFSCVSEMYVETSFLLKDFSEVLTGSRFSRMTPGNSIGTTYVSKALDSPRYWLTRYAGLFFKPLKQKADNPLLSVTVGFYGLGGKAVPPFLICGIAKGMDHPKQRWQYWWLYCAFLNDKDAFDYFITKNDEQEKFDHSPETKGEIIDFKCRYDRDSYHWPHSGRFFALPLLSVKDYNKIKELSNKLIELWNEQFN